MIRNCLNCNKEFETKMYQIKRGLGKYCSRSCISLYKGKDLVGKVFGKLTVMSKGKLVKNNYGPTYYWNAKCECGNEIEISRKHLISENVQSCGCLTKKPFGTAFINAKYAEYKWGAKNRNLPFEINIEDFKSIIKKNCHYCDSAPRIIDNKTLKIKCNGIVPITGIDRMDSSRGYTLDNCVPCCSFCNKMKREFEISDFLSHIEKISLYQKNKNLEFPPSYLAVVS